MMMWHLFNAMIRCNIESLIVMTKIKSKIFGFHRRHKGQAMTEFCVAVPLLVLLLWSILYLAEMYIVKHETLVAARYGTWLLSRYDNIPDNSVDIEQIRGLIANNFFKNESERLLVQEQHVGGDQDDSGMGDELEQNSESGEWIDVIVTFIADTFEPTGPFGAKGMGEGGGNPIAAAVANAIYNAVGVRMKELPITAERVLRALKEKGSISSKGSKRGAS